jgi:hypothetical protein
MIPTSVWAQKVPLTDPEPVIAVKVYPPRTGVGT